MIEDASWIFMEYYGLISSVAQKLLAEEQLEASNLASALGLVPPRLSSFRL